MNSQIKKHTYKFSDGLYNYVTISRAKNYDVESTQLPAPTISATNVASTGKPKITWTAVPGAEKYQVYQAKSSSGTYSRIYTTTGTTMTNTKAVVGVTYWYKVRAVDSDGNQGVFSPVIKRTCDLPMVTNVQCSNDTSTGGIKISWDPVEDADYYRLYRSTKPETGTYSTYDGKLTKLTYSNVNSTTPGTTYYYKVRAYINDNANATSAASEYASATRKCAQPVLETDTPNDAATGKPKLSWTAVDGAQRYRVGRANSANGTYNFLEYAEKTTWVDTSAVPGETYYYKVRAAAENSAGNSAMSNYVKRTCSALEITTQPQNATVGANDTVSFTVAANGSNLKYQWQYRTSSTGTWTNNSCTSATFIIAKPGTWRDGYQYRCIVTNSAESITSSIATLTVKSAVAKPEITTQPKSATVGANDTVSFTVAANGSNLKYQWQYRTSSTGTWTNNSCTSATFTITKPGAWRDGYQYRCKITNSAGTVYSSAATLTVR